jgi:hypothetical protein
LSVMALRDYRDVTIDNGRVQEVHIIDQHRYVEYYGIAKWKALMLERQNPPV